MAIIVNGTTIPTNGEYIKVGNTDVTKVNVVKDGVTTTVWEKVTSITPAASEVMNYINIDGNTLASTCDKHPNAIVVGTSVWYCRKSGGDKTETFTITPKAPYLKISCSLHKWGLCNQDEIHEVWANGAEVADDYEISNASSITIKCQVCTDGFEDHWKTEANCCIYNVTLS